MMVGLYNLGLRAYRSAIWAVARRGNLKAQQWEAGRRNWREHLILQLQTIADRPRPLWIHAASLGEFEQGRPLIELLKQRYPERPILLSFFSPSGYEIRKNYAFADVVVYLPLDTPDNARDWFSLVQPSAVVFVKYEFWYHYLSEAIRRKVPTAIVAALFRSSQHFFHWYGSWHAALLQKLEVIFVQNEASLVLAKAAGFKNIVRSGDTRVDRVWQIQARKRRFELVENFVAGNWRVLVAGSTWEQDETLLARWMRDKKAFGGFKVIIAPHRIDAAHLERIESQVELPLVRYSNANFTAVQTARVLLIDNIGMLADLYQYGQFAFIGGGFKTGLHNTLEPIAFGLPVFFGMNYHKFEEARYLVTSGGGFCVKDYDVFAVLLAKLLDTSVYEKSSNAAKNYIEQNRGATQQIFDYISQHWFKDECEI